MREKYKLSIGLFLITFFLIPAISSASGKNKPVNEPGQDGQQLTELIKKRKNIEAKAVEEIEKAAIQANKEIEMRNLQIKAKLSRAQLDAERVLGELRERNQNQLEECEARLNKRNIFRRHLEEKYENMEYELTREVAVVETDLKNNYEQLEQKLKIEKDSLVSSKEVEIETLRSIKALELKTIDEAINDLKSLFILL